MILTVAVLAGLLAGLARAWFGGRHPQVPQLRFVGLVVIAFIPQWLAFHLPATSAVIPDWGAALCLTFSQAILLLFAWVNRSHAGGVFLLLGLALNFLVIVANGGLMPISPEAVYHLAPRPPETWEIGSRLWGGKDIVLPLHATRLRWLSDYFLTPRWFPLQIAFSLGDLFISGGAFWLLWSVGRAAPAASSVAAGTGLESKMEAGRVGL
ncbi:MAG: DUF5317 family protein [Candidatus Promineifilaceae bacterium]|nr:DUF5317 family protein [Candidatus Promineifilaceae bacterium]